MNVTLQGRYKIVVRSGSQVSHETPWFDNLITDAGMDRIAQDDWFPYCFVGSGTTPAQHTDMRLENLDALTDNNYIWPDLITLSPSSSSSEPLPAIYTGAQSEAPYYGYRRVHFYFPLDAISNKYISEVGVGWFSDSASPSEFSSDDDSLSGYTLFSRALVIDSLGDYHPIRVREYETLEVQYELRLYPRLYDYVYQAVLAEQDTQCVARAADVTNGALWAWGVGAVSADLSSPVAVHGSLGGSDAESELGWITELPGGAANDGTVAEVLPYISGSHYRDFFVEWASQAANWAEGIGAVSFYTDGLGAFQVGFFPPLAKKIGSYLRLRLRVSWSRDESSSDSGYYLSSSSS